MVYLSMSIFKYVYIKSVLLNLFNSLFFPLVKIVVEF